KGGNGTGRVKLFDVRAARLIRTLPGPAQEAAPCDAVAFSPDGKRIAAGAQDRIVRVWDVGTGLLLWAGKGHAGTISAVAFSRDGRRVATAGGRDETVKLWDAQTGEEVLTVGRHPGRVHSVAFSPDGNKIVSASSADVRVWDATPLQK